MFKSSVFPNDSVFQKIEKTISMNHNLLSSVSLREGIPGVCLFYYYCFLYTQNTKYLNLIGEHLEYCIKLIRNKKIKNFSLYDLLELCRFAAYLQRKNLLDKKDINQLVLLVDTHAFYLLKTQIQKRNLESIEGIIGIGYYLFETYDFIKRNTILSDIVDLISEFAISTYRDRVHWLFPSYSGTKLYVKRFGSTNGQVGVLSFLFKLYKNQFRSDTCDNLIQKGIHDLLHYKGNYLGARTFPYSLASEIDLPYQNIAYGDIGISNFLYRYGEYTKQEDLKDTALKAIEKACLFYDDSKMFIKDAALLHGAAGLAAFFETYALKLNSSKVSEAATYWHTRVLNFGTLKTQWAGFDTYFNGYDDRFQLSFAYGLAGIGTFLIASELRLKHEYLSLLNFEIE